MQLSIKIDVATFTAHSVALANNIHLALQEELNNAGQEVLRTAQAFAPVKTGALRAQIEKTIKLSTSGPVVVTIRSKGKKAVWMERGTSPHTIAPKNGKFLKFSAGGKTVFARVVHHPGTKAYEYMKNALEVNTPNIYAACNRAINIAISRG